MAKKRILWIDIANIFAILGVVYLHCNLAIHTYSGSPNFEFFWAAGAHSFILWPVNVFYMLTGYTLIGRMGGCKKDFVKKE